jgi:hypothetical protein
LKSVDTIATHSFVRAIFKKEFACYLLLKWENVLRTALFLAQVTMHDGGGADHAVHATLMDKDTYRALCDNQVAAKYLRQYMGLPMRIVYK